MKKLVEEIIEDIRPLMSSYPWDNLEMYVRFISQQYYIVRHSTPMLALSCGRSLNEREYHIRCIEHLAEEKGHDKLLLNDIKASGAELYLELPATRSFYAGQYYMIEHVNPVSFLGYILFLESLAIYFGKELHDKALKHTKGVSFLKVHAADDIEHLEKAYEMIASFPAKHLEDIKANLLMSARAYSGMLQDLKLTATRTTIKKAA